MTAPRHPISADERDMILHALGLNYRRRWAYRNYFAAGERDKPIWEALVSRGLASRLRTMSPELCPYPVVEYAVTRLGVEAAGVGNKVPYCLTSPKTA